MTDIIRLDDYRRTNPYKDTLDRLVKLSAELAKQEVKLRKLLERLRPKGKADE